MKTELILLIILINVNTSINQTEDSTDSSTSETSSTSTSSTPLKQSDQITFCPANETDQVEFPWAADTLEDLHGKIILAIVIFRHADRSPAQPYPNDIHSNYPWPRGLGMLLKIGLWRAFRLGQYLRARYKHVCGEVFDDKRVSFHTIDLPRCVESGMQVTMGMFPANEDEYYNRWNDFNADGTERNTSSNCTQCLGYYMKPMVITMNRSWDDNTLALKKPCDKYDKLNEIYWKVNDSVEEFCKNNIIFFNYSMIHAGFPNNTQCRSYVGFWNLLRIYDTLFVHSRTGLEWPDWAKDESFPGYFEILRKYVAKYFQKQAEDVEIKKLLLAIARLILEDMTAKNETINRNDSASETNSKTQTIKCRMYSAQDLIIETMRKALNLFNDELLPPYSSFMAIEMRQKDKDIFVTTVYQNDTNKPPHVYKIPGCPDVACPLDVFFEILRNSSVQNWEDACQVDDMITSTARSSTESTTDNVQSTTDNVQSTTDNVQSTTDNVQSTTDSSKKKRKKKKRKKQSTTSTTEATTSSTTQSNQNNDVKLANILSKFIPFPVY